MVDKKLDRETSQANTTVEVQGLLGQHPRVQERALQLRLDEFLNRLRVFVQQRIPGFRAYREARQLLLAKERRRLRVDEFQPKVMTTFVRNRLINEVYLPIIGDNLAKQMGSSGAGKRTDTMGMLMLISPPGYGKTTLMEYIASQLGIVFMKVNGPSLGHEVHSLDPSEAPNATARQEVEKINLAFEMANNVMLYLDDIQHTHPELLQKFISLCDGTRRVEGVWKGRTRTYDLKGKRFCVVMAGNPYTETGARFQIPDMLANRADTYNLGDILGGREDLFALSYVENAITSNPTLAPLAARDQQDIYRLIRLAQGEEVDTSAFSHDYSAGERQEFADLFRKMFRVRDTLLKVNLEYIKSAATDDGFRTEPPFKLQGSYRNMSKVTEKLVSAMNLDEVDRLIEDHYVGESQTLTTGAENNLLKLWELRGTQSEEQRARWEAIKKDYGRQKLMGGSDDDPVARVVGTLAGMGDQIEQIGSALQTPMDVATPLAAVQSELSGLRTELSQRLGSPEQLSGALTGVVESLGTIGKAVETTHQGQRGTARILQAFGKNLVEAMNQRPAAAAAPASAPAAAPASPTERSWFLPNLEVGAEADLVMRHAVLLEVQRALVAYGRMQHDAARQLRAGEYVLAGALPVMQHLADHITTLVHERLPEAQRGPFMDELRRGVARAIKELSDATGERVDATAVAPSEQPTGETPTTVLPPRPPQAVRTTQAQVRHDAPPVRKP